MRIGASSPTEEHLPPGRIAGKRKPAPIAESGLVLPGDEIQLTISRLPLGSQDGTSPGKWLGGAGGIENHAASKRRRFNMGWAGRFCGFSHLLNLWICGNRCFSFRNRCLLGRMDFSKLFAIISLLGFENSFKPLHLRDEWCEDQKGILEGLRLIRNLQCYFCSTKMLKPITSQESEDMPGTVSNIERIGRWMLTKRLQKILSQIIMNRPQRHPADIGCRLLDILAADNNLCFI